MGEEERGLEQTALILRGDNGMGNIISMIPTGCSIAAALGNYTIIRARMLIIGSCTIEVLRAANCLSDDADLSQPKRPESAIICYDCGAFKYK